MKRDNWLVKENSIGLTYPPVCTHCEAPLGEQHKEGCVTRKRTIVVKAEINYVITVPEDWDTKQIEFYRNESSWCATNTLDELSALSERNGCLCGEVRFTYVREATKEDEDEDQKYIKDLQ